MICCLNPDCQKPINTENVEWCLSCGSKLIPLLRGRYQPIEPIGGGGFGRTYLAQDTDNLNERCVIKQLAPQLQSGSALKKATQLFKLEAQRLKQLLEHPQIPSLYAYFEENNELYLVQQFVEGSNLSQELKQQGKFNESKIRELLQNLLPILDFVHQQNVVHRDMKPANIIRRDRDRQVVLIDFGVAQQQAAKPSANTATIVGSPGYTALEQMEKGEASASSDLYSLGVTCFHLLTNVHPFHLWAKFGYSWTSNWRKYLREPISKELASILDRMLQTNKKDRYQSALEILEDLNEAHSLSIYKKFLLDRKLIKVGQFLTIALSVLGVGFWLFKITHPSASMAFERTSLGEKILIPTAIDVDKVAGVQHYAQKDFDRALQRFYTSLAINPNDPETLIYLNNTKAEIRNRRLKLNSPKSLQIGVSVPIGSHSNIAEEILRGVAQAQNELNQKNGIDGKLLQVKIANDENEPKIAQKVANTFVRDRQILAVVGHNSSKASVAAAPIYEKGRLVMVSPTSTSDNLLNKGDYIFRMTPSVSLLAEKLYNYIDRVNTSPVVGICYDHSAKDNTWFVDRLEQSIDSSGGKLSDVPCDLSAVDFSSKSAIAQMKKQKVNALVLAPHIDRLEQAIEVAQANHQQIPLFGSLSLYTFKTLQLGMKNVNNLVLSVPWYPDAVPKDTFSKSAKQLWGGAVTWRTAMAYDTTKTLTIGLKQKSDRDRLKDILKSTSFSYQGTTGDIKFQNSGERRAISQIVSLVQVKRGRISGTGYDFLMIP
jgi:ABC-type branched-subunit amino acid transport system substrate-binding protein/tRNA A-37 threonylcarbamoyl transferase component Bud32